MVYDVEMWAPGAGQAGSNDLTGGSGWSMAFFVYNRPQAATASGGLEPASSSPERPPRIPRAFPFAVSPAARALSSSSVS